MAVCRILALFLLSVAVIQADKSHDRDDDELEQKYKIVVNEVVDLRETMKVMKEDMKRLKRVSRALDALCEELRSDDILQESEGDIAVDKQKSTAAEDAEETDEQIQLTSLKTKNSSGTYSFQLGYHSSKKVDGATGNSGELYISANSPKMELNNSFSDGSGVINGKSEHDDIYVELVNNKSGIWAHFKIKNDSDVDLPALEISTDINEDLVFEPDQSSQVKVRTNKKSSPDSAHYVRFSYGLFIARRNETEKVILSTSPESRIINQTSVKEYLNYTEYSLTLNKDKEDYEGLAYIQLSVHGRIPGSVGFDISSYLIFYVRRSDHKEPFSRDFLGFVEGRYPDFGVNCDVYSDGLCSLRIRIVGYQPANITLLKIPSNGVPKQLSLPVTYRYDQYMVGAVFILSNVSRSDAGRYIYRGSSHTGKIIEKEFQVNVTILYVILRNESEVVQDTRNKLVIRCVGRGYPDPEIRFYDFSVWSNKEITEGPGISIEKSMMSDEMTSSTLTIEKNNGTSTEIYCQVRGIDEEYPEDNFKIYDKNASK